MTTKNIKNQFSNFNTSSQNILENLPDESFDHKHQWKDYEALDPESSSSVENVKHDISTLTGKKQDQYFQSDRELEAITTSFRFRDTSSFVSLNKWEGVVEEIEEETFSAILTDLTAGRTKEFTNFDKKEVSPDDEQLLIKGALFYWSIGYEQIHGQVRKASLIRFKRLPKWSKKQIDHALDTTNKFKNQIKWD